MGLSWHRGILVLGLATQVGAQGSPNLSMAGTQQFGDGATRSPSEEQVRREVIRRLEARIRARREREAAAEATRVKIRSAQEELAPDEGERLDELRAAVRRANQLPAPSAHPASEGEIPVTEGDFPPAEDREVPPVGRRPEETGSAYVSPAEVRNNLGWGPPESLAGREQGILPPEVTGEPTPPRGPLAVAPAIPAREEVRSPASPSVPAGPREHVLAPGETLWALSRRYKISVKDLIRYNAVSNVDDLSVGTRLQIPRSGEAVTGPAQVGTVARAPRVASPPPEDVPPAVVAGSYKVLRGDTLYKIARSHHVTVDELLRANPNISASHLAPGMTLTVPGAGGARATRPAPTRASSPAPRVAPIPGPRARPVASSKGDNPYLEWPVSGTVTANFGWKDGKPHTGIDISAGLGTVVRAAATGKVIFSGQMRGYGNVVILDHLNGFFTVYGHNQRNLVHKGGSGAPRTVQRGQAVAKVGATGDAVAPQLHFEVRKLNQAVDPFRYLANRAGERAARPSP
jgi:murein DD-endopeptidase MepM/ murein hydrolase activator NlpD